MLLKQLTVRNYGPHKGERIFAFERKKQKIAIVGDNGEGKTFILDGITLALFGKAPNRPKGIYELFNDEQRHPVKDGLIQLDFELDGQTVRVTRHVDSVARKQLATISVNGETLTEGKQAEFASAIQSLGLDERVFFTSAYAAQNGSGHLVGMGDGDKRDLLSRILSLDQFVKDHELVEQAYNELIKQLEALSQQMLTTKENLPNFEALGKEREELEAELSQLNKGFQTLQKEQQEYMIRLAEAEANAQDHNHLLNKASDYRKEITAAEASLSRLNQQVEQYQLLNQKAEQMDSALAEDRELTERQAETETKRQQLLTQADELDKDVTEAVKIKQDELQRHAEETKLAIEKVKEDDKKVLLNLEALWKEHEAEYLSAKKKSDDHFSRLDFIKRDKNSIEKILEKLQKRLSLVDAVPCNDQPALVSACQLLSDARQARQEIEQLNAELEGIEKKRQQLLSDEDTLPDAETLRQDADEAREAYQQAARTQSPRVISLTESLEALREQYAKEAQKLHNLPGKPLRAEASQLTEQLKGMQVKRFELALILEERAQLEAAKAGFNQLSLSQQDQERSLSTLKQRLAEVQEKLEDAKALKETKEAIACDLNAVKSEIDRFTANKEATTRRLGAIEADIATAVKTQEKLTFLEAQRLELGRKLPVLALLKEGLSPKGAPALKIDAAGPEITEIINTLLQECYGPKFSVRLLTTKENRSNDTVRENIHIQVLENETGQETPVESLSGGEQAIVKEAISMGLAIFARKCAGTDLKCLIRDETTAPLSDANGEKYIQMLDKACELGGFQQVIYVSHKGILQDMADSVIKLSKTA